MRRTGNQLCGCHCFSFELKISEFVKHRAQVKNSYFPHLTSPYSMAQARFEKALYRTLTTQLFQHEAITTTLTKAKRLRSVP